MVIEKNRPLKVFLCHASGDKLAVRDLYKHLVAEGVDAWLDQEKLLPGQDWRVEIPRAVREADVVVICLSNKSITKEGYVQKEIKFALDSAEEKPEGTIFLIPARLEDCVVPEGLDRWQWVDLFDENGFLRLLRSLRLRADKVGDVIESLGSGNADQEVEHRLDQLYTEGLAAFWVEDWERACQRFQTILRERPNHKNAAEKLAEAEHQRNLVKLYAEASEAYTAEDWPTAVKTLENLLEKSGEYKDAVPLLKDAKKQRKLQELYAEVKKLYAAQKWQAVVRIFEQISAIEPNFPDLEELFSSAKNELAALERIEELNERYRQAVHHMDAGQWYEARSLLEKIHKKQTGFLDTERLLRKVENEVLRIEDLNKRNIYINTLYEQAHGLIRSKNWRKALDKIEEIRKLDDQFVDKDAIAAKAEAGLAREEEIAQQQNQLAAMYAEAVRVMKEGNYQDALDKWHQVKSIDPKYPDRQWLHRTARKKLAEASRTTLAPLAKHRTILFVLGLIFVTGLILLTLVSPPIMRFVSGSITPTSTVRAINTAQLTSTLAVPEYHIQLVLLTSSDWTELKLLSGGKLTHIKKISSSSEASKADSDFAKTFYLNQPLARADGVNTVQVLWDAILTNITAGTQLVFEGKRGCIGRTTVQLFRVIDTRVLVKSFSWDNACETSRRFYVLVDPFIR